MTPEEQDEARAIFEREFGTTDQLADHVRRAQESATAFRESAEAFVHGDITSAHSAMENYAANRGDLGAAFFELACVGVFTIAEFVRALAACESCGRADCTSVHPFLGVGEDADSPAYVAVFLVNTVIQEPATGTLREAMLDLYREVGTGGVHRIAVELVDVYAQVREMVRDEH